MTIMCNEEIQWQFQSLKWMGNRCIQRWRRWEKVDDVSVISRGLVTFWLFTSVDSFQFEHVILAFSKWFQLNRITKKCSLNIVPISFSFTRIDSSWKALHFVFWVQNHQIKGLAGIVGKRMRRSAIFSQRGDSKFICSPTVAPIQLDSKDFKSRFSISIKRYNQKWNWING